MSTTLRAVRLDVDGTLTDLQLPTGHPAYMDAMDEQVGGTSETAHYARPDGSRRLAVVVNSDGIVRDLPENLYATSLVNAIRLKGLAYALRGPVVLVGAADRAGDLTDLPDVLHAVLPNVVAALKARFAPTP